MDGDAPPDTESTVTLVEASKPTESQTMMLSALKAYSKMLNNHDNRPAVIKDPTFRTVITSMLAENQATVLKPLIEVLLKLTGSKDDALLLAEIPNLDKQLNDAAEREGLSPSIAHNLIVVASRIKSAKSHSDRGDLLSTRSETNTSTAPKRFMQRKSKELVFEFDSMNEGLRSDLEQRATKRRGVISVYVDVGKRRAVLRVTLATQAAALIDDFFELGHEAVAQVIRNAEGVEELHHHYVSEREHKKEVNLPDYLDDHLVVTNPNECIITKDQAAKAASGGWFSSVLRSFW